VKNYFLGVDGGGTKTAFLILDDNGAVCGRHEETSSYHLQVGIEGLRRVLTNGIEAVLAIANLTATDLTHAFLGLPAYGEDSRVQHVIDEIPEPILGHWRYTCGNDMVCGWAGSLACADGINIVAGTGSIGYGEYQGRSARGGGWGEVFGDEGSAYWIAVQGLSVFSRMADGRLPKGPLYDIIRTQFALVEDLDLSGLLTGEAGPGRDRIASVSRMVADALESGDDHAQHIFRSAAHELAMIANSIARALNFDAQADISLSYSGGVFNAGQAILKPFREELQQSSFNFSLTPPKFDPTVGAALYAAKISSADAAQRIVAGSVAKNGEG
jgi:N-acetylglucosamine kinase-like BadF-type ATPase